MRLVAEGLDLVDPEMNLALKTRLIAFLNTDPYQVPVQPTRNSTGTATRLKSSKQAADGRAVPATKACELLFTRKSYNL